MSFSGFYTPADAARAARYRPTEAAESRQRAVALRQQHEQTTARLRAGLPFTWQVGQVRRRYQGPPVWERGPATIHIQLQQPVQLPGKGQPIRPAGDWLCRASLDTDTGELRYETQAAPEHSDGSGGPAAHYLPAPTCKRCLKVAEQLVEQATPAPAAKGQ